MEISLYGLLPLRDLSAGEQLESTQDKVRGREEELVQPEGHQELPSCICGFAKFPTLLTFGQGSIVGKQMALVTRTSTEEAAQAGGEVGSTKDPMEAILLAPCFWVGCPCSRGSPISKSLGKTFRTRL